MSKILSSVILILLLFPQAVSANHIPDCSGVERGELQAGPIAASEACPANTCFIDDVRDTGTTYRCYSIKTSTKPPPDSAVVASSQCSLRTDPSPIVIRKAQAQQGSFAQGDYLPPDASINYFIKVDDLDGIYDVYLRESITGDYGWKGVRPNSEGNLTNDGKPLLIRMSDGYSGATEFKAGDHTIKVTRQGVPGSYCQLSYKILREADTKQTSCSITGPKEANSSTQIKLGGQVSPPGDYQFIISKTDDINVRKEINFAVGDKSEININIGSFNPAIYKVFLAKKQNVTDSTGLPQDVYTNTNCTINNLKIDSIADKPNPDTTPVEMGAGTPAGPEEAKDETAGGVNCAKDPDNKDCSKSGGEKCPDESEGIFTAIGCVPTEPQAFVTGILKFVTAASGGIALLLMILGAIQMITAEGNPENINAAREKFYSAIIGLLFIIFAVLLLEIIGVDILGLPGFGSGQTIS